MQIPTSLLGRKELGWSKLRLRPWPWCPATQDTHSALTEAPRATWVLGTQVPPGHAALPAASQTHQSGRHSRLLLLLCPERTLLAHLKRHLLQRASPDRLIWTSPLPAPLCSPPDTHTAQLLISAGLCVFAQMSPPSQGLPQPPIFSPYLKLYTLPQLPSSLCHRLEI